MKEYLKEIKTLCQLELSIINEGKIKDDGEGILPHVNEYERLKGLDNLMEKYHYGWYIAESDMQEQLRQINHFKIYILANNI